MTIISTAFSDYIRVHLFRKSVYYKQKDTNRSNNFNWVFCCYSCPIQKKYVCELEKGVRMSASTVYTFTKTVQLKQCPTTDIKVYQMATSH